MGIAIVCSTVVHLVDNSPSHPSPLLRAARVRSIVTILIYGYGNYTFDPYRGYILYESKKSPTTVEKKFAPRRQSPRLQLQQSPPLAFLKRRRRAAAPVSGPWGSPAHQHPPAHYRREGASAGSVPARLAAGSSAASRTSHRAPPRRQYSPPPPLTASLRAACCQSNSQRGQLPQWRAPTDSPALFRGALCRSSCCTEDYMTTRLVNIFFLGKLFPGCMSLTCGHPLPCKFQHVQERLQGNLGPWRGQSTPDCVGPKCRSTQASLEYELTHTNNFINTYVSIYIYIYR